MCCLESLASVLPCVDKTFANSQIIPIFVQASKDSIPNVKFCVSKLIGQNRHLFDSKEFNNSLFPALKEMAADPDRDVAYFAQIAMQSKGE